VINTAIDGQVYARTTRYDYEVVANTDSAGSSWVEYTSTGDTRSRSDMIHAGIYNVYLANN
jgi:hypothetical protein